MNAQELPLQPEQLSVSSDIEAIMARVKVAHANMPAFDEKAEDSRVKSEMLKAGYPSRAVDRLDSMHGPSLEKAKSLLPLILSGDCIILLHGDRGPGKTQMATYWAHQRAISGKGYGKYIKTFDFLAKIKASWTDSKQSEPEILRPYQRTKFLVLDEFQERSESEWDNRTLTNILDHRYDDRLATVLICNLNDTELADRVPASILSRAEEVGGRVHCDWPSYRQNR